MFSLLGFRQETDILSDFTRGIYVCFLKNEHCRVEVIQPVDETSAFFPLLKKYKNSAYHICYETTDICASVMDLKKKGFMQTQEVAPASAIGGKNVVFMVSPKIGLVELVETRG